VDREANAAGNIFPKTNVDEVREIQVGEAYALLQQNLAYILIINLFLVGTNSDFPYKVSLIN
jgi:hypothetical protein